MISTPLENAGQNKPLLPVMFWQYFYIYHIDILYNDTTPPSFKQDNCEELHREPLSLARTFGAWYTEHYDEHR